ncbi:MAG: hypothetical protein LC768_08310 [Acidobacteria bacterium]|nr:hypothetical protein [Acidobacteriota bacterium]
MLHDTSPEFEKMWHERWLRKTPQERAKFAFSMFSAARKIIIASMPENLSEIEQKRFIYERTYGEPLPADFTFRRN